MNIIRSIYLTYFSLPTENRALYQAVTRRKPRRIVEFGLQRGERTLNMLELARHYRRVQDIEYVCIDPFESRTIEDGPGLSIRKAYKLLTQCGVRARLIPEQPENALPLLADLAGSVDIMVVATPSLDWIRDRKTEVAGLLEPNGLVCLGTSSPDGSPFELLPYTAGQLLRYDDSCRRAA